MATRVEPLPLAAVDEFVALQDRSSIRIQVGRSHLFDRHVEQVVLRMPEEWVAVASVTALSPVPHDNEYVVPFPTNVANVTTNRSRSPMPQATYRLPAWLWVDEPSRS